MKKKTGLKGIVTFFSIDFNPIHINDILDIHRYLMKRKQYKIMFGIIKKMFILLLNNIVNGTNLKRCISLSNKKCMIQPTLINLYPNEHLQEFHY